MHLTPASFDPQWIKGEMLQYFEGLIVCIKNNHNFVWQSFCNALMGDKNLKHYTLQPWDLI